MHHAHDASRPLLWRPSLGARLLPGCGHCGARHPLAHTPPLPEGVCPGCGTLLIEAPPPVEVDAVLTGYRPSVLLARACFSIGGWFAKLWRSRQ